jgi:hypothetical protein
LWRLEIRRLLRKEGNGLTVTATAGKEIRRKEKGRGLPPPH